MIKAVLFDFDGVLTTDETGSLTTIRSLSAETGLSEQSIWHALAPFNRELLLGRTSHKEIWAKVCATLGRQLAPQMLVRAFDSTPIDHEMLAYARSLKPAYSVGIVTDNKADRMDRLIARHRLDELFDSIVVSATQGSGKDDPRVFQAVLDELGVLPEQSIFIDNTLRNLVAPAALGMHTLHFVHGSDTAGSLAVRLEALHKVGAPQVAPNNSFKPKLLRSGNGVAG